MKQALSYPQSYYNLMTNLLITLEFPPQTGGVANYYYHIVQELSRNCKIITLTTPNQPFITEDNLTTSIVLRRPLLFTKFWPKWLLTLYQTFKIIKSYKIKLIIIGHILPLGYVSLIFKTIFNIPYIVCVHGLDILAPQKSKWQTFWLKKILKQAHCITSNSNFVKLEVIKLNIPADKIIVLYPGSNILKNHNQRPDNANANANANANLQTTQNISPEIKYRTKHNLTENDIILLSVGRLVDRKGFDIVIKSLPTVWKERQNVKYILFGDGPEKSKLQNLAQQIMSQSGKPHHIIFPDSLSDLDKEYYYKLSDIFIMTPKELKYDCEGFGIVYLEASQSELPLIGSNSGGVPEVVLNNINGLLIKPDDINETAAAIIKLAQNQTLRKTLGQKGKQNALEKFQWTQEVSKLLNVIQNT